MGKNGWIIRAYKNNNLKPSSDMICPICNPEKKVEVDCNIIACEKHTWAYEKWFRKTFSDQIDDL